MSSALISLAVYGRGTVQEPSLSQFSAQYVKHTNFAIESYKTTSKNSDEFGTKSYFDVPRVGDMITGATLEFDLPDIEIDSTPATPTETITNTNIFQSGTWQNTVVSSTPETLRGTGFAAGTNNNIDSSKITKIYFKKDNLNSTFYNLILNVLKNNSNSFFGTINFLGSNCILYVTSIIFIDEFIEISGLNENNNDYISSITDIYSSTSCNFLTYSGYTPQYGYVNNEGFAAIESVEFLIGSQVIQKLSGEYLYINSRVNVTASNRDLVERLTGTMSEFPLKNYNGLASSNIQDVNNLNEWTRDVTKTIRQELTTSNVYFPYGKAHDVTQLETNGVYPRRYVVNLPFWFTEHISKSIPLCAITKQELSVIVKFRDYHSLIYNVYGPINTSDPRINNKKLENVSLKFEYAFLDQKEIDFIKNRDMNMVVSQLQVNEFNVSKNENILNDYQDIVFNDFRNNYNTKWQDYHTKQSFRLHFDNSVSRMYFLVQNDEYAKSPSDDNSKGWYGNQWFNYMPETTGYLFKDRTNNSRVEYIDTKTSSNITYQVVSSSSGPGAPTSVSNNFPNSYIPGSMETFIGSGQMTWLIPDSSNTECPFFSQFINPQTGARRRDQYLIFNKTDLSGNTNQEWWSNIAKYDFFQVIETTKYSGGDADPPNSVLTKPFITYEFSFDNVVSITDDHIYVAAHDVSYRNDDWQWDFDINGKSKNVVGASTNEIEIRAGNHLDKGKFLRNVTNWPYMNQVDNLELTFNGEVVLPKEVADTLFLTGVQSLNHDNTMPFQITNINAARPGPFQLLSSAAITSNPESGYDFNVTTESKVPFLENIYKYDFGITNDFSKKYPTGQVNSSRIKDNILKVDFMPSTSDRKLRVYAESYNILKIKNGIAGILFTCGNLVD